MKTNVSAVLAASLFLLAGCNSSEAPSGVLAPGPVAAGEGAPRVPVAATRDGIIYRQAIQVAATGDTQVFQVFEPTHLEVGKSYPLVLEGHGYGGARQTTAGEGSFIRRLLDAGFYVISVDERGFGETTGTVRVMDPEFEGLDLVAVLDWAEDLEGLRRGSDGKMVVGSYGGSYGGMYQFMLMGTDPLHRLHVLAPDITPHDLTYSLDPNDVVKSGYGLALSAAAEASPRAEGLRQDIAIEEILSSAVLSNAFSESAKNFFKYHSVAYFCDGEQPGPQSFILATPDQGLVPPTPFPRADVLLTQGMRDTLFNFNDGWNNYQCMKALGGDVRLLTHQSGHILPVSLTSVPFPAGGTLEDALDPFYTALTLPNFQDAGGSRSCGTINLQDATFAWLEAKLKNTPQARAALDAAIPSGSDFCLSLGEGDAVAVREVQKASSAPIAIDSSIPQFSAVLGVIGGALGNGAREVLLATQSLYTAPAGGAILAGLPQMELDVAGLTGAEMGECPTPLNLAACDPILLLAIGHRKAGTQRWDVIDDQLTPVRGFGAHTGDMSGIAERLAEGDQVGLLVYGFHAQFPVTWSRDVFVPAVNLTGSVSLPLVPASAIVRELRVAGP